MDGFPCSTNNDMRKPLQSLADIRIGHTFRGRIENDPAGNVGVLQIKDIKGRDEVSAASLLRMQWKGSGAPPTLAAGDIVVPARGEYYKAAVADGVEPIVPTSQFFVLHARSKTIMPEFLCWYLNQPTARNYFLGRRTGSNIQMLNKDVLGALSIKLPPLETQHRIVALHRMSQEERRLTEQLLLNHETMLAGIYQRLLES